MKVKIITLAPLNTVGGISEVNISVVLSSLNPSQIDLATECYKDLVTELNTSESLTLRTYT